MPVYMIPVDVLRANGSQTFSVEADTVEDAIAILRGGGGEFEEEEVEVTHLGMDSINVDDVWVKE